MQFSLLQLGFIVSKNPKMFHLCRNCSEILSSDQKYDFQNSEPLMRVRNVFFHKTRKEKAPTQSVVLFVCKSGLRLQNILFDRFDNIYIFLLGVVMVQGVLKEFCQNTSIHGLSSIVEAKSSLIKRIAWFVIFVISISYAGIQLKDNVDSKLT